MPKKRAKRQSFSEQVRSAIENSGLTRYQIAKMSGVSQSALSRFVVDGREMNTATIDLLAETLGWSLNVEKQPNGKRK